MACLGFAQAHLNALIECGWDAGYLEAMRQCLPVIDALVQEKPVSKRAVRKEIQRVRKRLAAALCVLNPYMHPHLAARDLVRWHAGEGIKSAYEQGAFGDAAGPFEHLAHEMLRFDGACASATLPLRGRKGRPTGNGVAIAEALWNALQQERERRAKLGLLSAADEQLFSSVLPGSAFAMAANTCVQVVGGEYEPDWALRKLDAKFKWNRGVDTPTVRKLLGLRKNAHKSRDKVRPNSS